MGATIFGNRPAPPTHMSAPGRRKHEGLGSHSWRSSQWDGSRSTTAVLELERAAEQWLDARAQGRPMAVVDANLDAALSRARSC